MEVGETLRVESIDAWRRWLLQHHADRREIWLINDRKGPQRRTPDYEDLLDEAVCHGWVDVLVRGLDETRYYTRWVPRRPRRQLDRRQPRARAPPGRRPGRMTEAGMATLPDDLRAELAR